MKETPEQRCRTMKAVRSRDTKPEMVVRRFIHAKGLRYRLHRRDLPGSPDCIFRPIMNTYSGPTWTPILVPFFGIRVMSAKSE